MSAPIAIKLYDLSSAARAGKLHDVIARDQELIRLVRILLRPNHHHAILVADPGTGKTSLIESLTLRLSKDLYRPLDPQVYRLNPEPIKNLLMHGDSLRQTLSALAEAIEQIKSATIVIEDIQLLAADDPGRLEHTMALLKALAGHDSIRLIVTTTAREYHRIFRDDYVFSRLFDAVEVQPPSKDLAIQMVTQKVPAIEAHNHQSLAEAAITEAVVLGGRYGHGRSLPDSAIRLLEEACVKASLESHNQVSATDIQQIVADRENLPARALITEQATSLADLEPKLRREVIGQPGPLRQISRQLARSHLGLADPSRPRGSFLLLGPSGVGKTQTAKAIAKTVYQNESALVRLDMSEYSEPHSAIRLIGSPPGYVGYEEGGQLTSAVLKEPYSLVLLDEIEKAHPKLFDLFLQLLDDGRLTDSAGHTVDFTQTLVMATSNTGSQAIADAASSGVDTQDPEFMRRTLLPLLMRTYRPEFINRFDAILIYQPLSFEHLVALAKKELALLETRLSESGIKFAVPDSVIADLLRPVYNPLFGARPVKRLLADRFENPLADLIINRHLTGPVTITGSEPWLLDEVTR
jgi:ATP-dependent Clp protease ATP-binding subunit ClpC